MHDPMHPLPRSKFLSTSLISLCPASPLGLPILVFGVYRHEFWCKTMKYYLAKLIKILTAHVLNIWDTLSVYRFSEYNRWVGGWKKKYPKTIQPRESSVSRFSIRLRARRRSVICEKFFSWFHIRDDKELNIERMY